MLPALKGFSLKEWEASLSAEERVWPRGDPTHTVRDFNLRDRQRTNCGKESTRITGTTTCMDFQNKSILVKENFGRLVHVSIILTSLSSHKSQGRYVYISDRSHIHTHIYTQIVTHCRWGTLVKTFLQGLNIFHVLYLKVYIYSYSSKIWDGILRFTPV